MSQDQSPLETRIETEMLDRLAYSIIDDADDRFIDPLENEYEDYARDRDDDIDVDELHAMREMDRILEEDFAERSPYRGMTPEQKREYDLKYMESQSAAMTSLGDILKAAILNGGSSKR